VHLAVDVPSWYTHGPYAQNAVIWNVGLHRAAAWMGNRHVLTMWIVKLDAPGLCW
jgi:hypothetical protein